MIAPKLTFTAVALVASALAKGPANAQELVEAPSTSAPLYIIAHVDIMPPHISEGRQTLVAYARVARGEHGAKRIDSVQEVFPNHFDLVEIWEDQKA